MVLDEDSLRKYSPVGDVPWTEQLGVGRAEANALAIDETGVYVVGSTGGHLPGNSSIGGWDMFTIRYDFEGNALWFTYVRSRPTERDRYQNAADSVRNHREWP